VTWGITHSAGGKHQRRCCSHERWLRSKVFCEKDQNQTGHKGARGRATAEFLGRQKRRKGEEDRTAAAKKKKQKARKLWYWEWSGKSQKGERRKKKKTEEEKEIFHRIGQEGKRKKKKKKQSTSGEERRKGKGPAAWNRSKESCLCSKRVNTGTVTFIHRIKGPVGPTVWEAGKKKTRETYTTPRKKKPYRAQEKKKNRRRGMIQTKKKKEGKRF